MNNETALFATLDARFGADEARDIAKHGCSGGVSGFIYSTELYEFFEEHEDDIEEVLEDCDTSYQMLVPDFETMQQIREAAVWFAVEVFCQNKTEGLEANDW